MSIHSKRVADFGKQTRLHRRLRCPRHHGPGRKSPDPPLAGETRRGRAGGPLGEPHRPARLGDRGPQSPIRLLLTWLPLNSLADPDPGPASVLFDEFDPGFLKSCLYLVSGVGSAA